MDRSTSVSSSALSWLATVAWVVAFGLLVLVIAWRAQRVYHDPVVDPHGFGFCDFHDAVYFPGRAFQATDNPYSAAYAAKYPVNYEYPPFSPALLLLTLPFTLLPIHAAEAAWFLFNVGLTLVLAWTALRLNRIRASGTAVFGLATLILASRSGHSNLIVGQLALPLSLGCLLALSSAEDKPWKSAVGVAIASLKPTFGIPLIGLMLFRRQWRPVGLGVIISIIIMLPAVAWMALGSGFSLTSLLDSQAAQTADMEFDPASAWMRIDTLNLLSRVADLPADTVTELAIMLVHILLIGGFLWCLPRPGENSTQSLDLASAIVCLTILLSVYHLSYDALIVVPLIVAGVTRRQSSWQAMPRWLTYSVAVLLTMTLMNYLATYSVLERFEIRGWVRGLCVSLNSLFLLAALCLLLFAGRWRTLRISHRHSNDK